MQHRVHGQLVFVRLRYDAAQGRRCGPFPQFITWAHDYPRAERNLTKILDEVTYIDPFQGPYGGNVLALDDPELHKFPIAYMAEPGHWYPSEAEVLGLRRYVEKGGFLIFDDFWDAHWENFESQMRRVLPDARLLPVDLAHPVFQSFFEIESLEMPAGVRLAGRVSRHLRGQRPVRPADGDRELQQRHRRVLGVLRHRLVPIDLSNEAYKFGVNYLMYAMTH